MRRAGWSEDFLYLPTRAVTEIVTMLGQQHNNYFERLYVRSKLIRIIRETYGVKSL